MFVRIKTPFTRMKVLYSFLLLCLLTINTVCAQEDEADAEHYILCINANQ